MSGFEIAGIVLAVVPLIWDAIKDTPETSVGKVSRAFFKAPSERQEFADELLFAHTAIRNEMLEIFMRINVLLTDSQRKSLTDPKNVGANFIQVWNDVYDANGTNVKTLLDTTIEDICPVLEKMAQILIEMVKDTKISSDEGREKLRNILKMDKDGTLSITKHLRDRFKFARSSPRRRRLLNMLKQNIELLKSITRTQAKSAELLAEGNLFECQRQSGPFLEKVRRYSDNLHDALLHTWNCDCHTSRVAMLKLEKREAPVYRETSKLLFSLILSSNHSQNEDCAWTFRETEVSVDFRTERRVAFDVEAVDHSSHPDHPPVDICGSLASPTHPPEGCLAFVLSERLLSWETEAATRKTIVKIEKDGISLDSLLERTLQSPSPRLSKDECLPLAIIIASSLLQLHATPWLQENWCAGSIYFADLLNDQQTRVPYITSKLGESSRPPRALARRGHHPDLVALGIILLELSEKKPISKWYADRTFGGTLPDDIRGKAEAAWDWFEEDASERMSPHYAIALKHCLNAHFLGPFAPNSMTLANEGFREAVYCRIVLHLEKAWSEYTKPLTNSTLQRAF